MTKSRISKILNLKQNVDCNLAEVAEKPFRASKFILKSPKLIFEKIRSIGAVHWYLLKNQGLKQHIFDRATLSGFTIREFTAKEDLNTQKHVLFY